MTSAVPDILSGYQAAREAAAYFPLPAAGYLRIGGQDRQSFLQRQTTNDVRRLATGRALVTVLTSSTARILDVLALLEEPDAIAALTLPGRASDTAGFLRSRIFFMDKVTVSDASAEFAQLDLLGPQAAAVLSRLGLQAPSSEENLSSGEIEAQPVRALHLPGLGIRPGFLEGFRLLLPAEGLPVVVRALEGAGASPLSEQAYQVLRVEAGLPSAGRELVEDFTPLETGLEAVISDEKGCYTGQEVIARQITYDKVTRRLVGLALSALASPGDRVWPQGSDRPAGEVTSAVVSPRLGPLALAVLRRPFDEPGAHVTVGEASSGVPGTVAALPFKDQ